MRQFVATDRLPIEFNAGGWVQIQSVSEDVEVLVQGADGPLMVLFKPYERGGQVATPVSITMTVEESILQSRALIFRL